MAYCPECGSEYTAGIERCVECQVALVQQPPASRAEELVDVLATSDRIEGRRIVEDLVQRGIECMLRDQASSSFPLGAGGMERLTVAVAEFDRDRALAELRSMIEAGEVSETGWLVE